MTSIVNSLFARETQLIKLDTKRNQRAQFIVIKCYLQYILAICRNTLTYFFVIKADESLKLLKNLKVLKIFIVVYLPHFKNSIKLTCI